MTPPSRPVSWIRGVGCMGDSLSREYFNRKGTAHNWVELLAWGKRLDFGMYMPPPSTWDDTAHSGYEYNWSLAGKPNKDSGTALAASEVQAPGLARRVRSSEVNVATLEVNHDFANDTDGNPFRIYDNIYYQKPGFDLAAYTDSVVKAWTSALDTVRCAGHVRMVAFTITDFGMTPFIRESIGGQPPRNPDEVKRKLVADAVADADAKLKQVAEARHVPVVDLFAFLHFVQEGGPVVVGGVTLTLTGFRNPADPHFFFADSQHPGTVASGLIGNMVVMALNKAHGAKVEPLSDQDILRYAGIPAAEIPPAPKPTYFDVDRFVRV